MGSKKKPKVAPKVEPKIVPADESTCDQCGDTRCDQGAAPHFNRARRAKIEQLKTGKRPEWAR